ARRRRSTPRPRAPRSRAGHVADFAGPEATAHPPDLRWNTSLLGVGSAESPPSPVLPGAFGAPPSLESVSPAPPAPSSSPAAPSGAPPAPCPGSPPAPPSPIGVGVPPTHLPASQVPVFSHGSPSGLRGSLHAPVSGSQVPATWHSSS